jgi:hypothetical protein
MAQDSTTLNRQCKGCFSSLIDVLEVQPPQPLNTGALPGRYNPFHSLGTCSKKKANSKSYYTTMTTLWVCTIVVVSRISCSPFSCRQCSKWAGVYLQTNGEMLLLRHSVIQSFREISIAGLSITFWESGRTLCQMKMAKCLAKLNNILFNHLVNSIRHLWTFGCLENVRCQAVILSPASPLCSSTLSLWGRKDHNMQLWLRTYSDISTSSWPSYNVNACSYHMSVSHAWQM